MNSNESLLALISDNQMTTQCFHDASRDEVLNALRGTISDLIALYNRAKGDSLILVNYSNIAIEIKAIDNWAGQAFQKDDEVDIALQAIAKEIDFPRNGSVKRIQQPEQPTKANMKYTLWAYNTGSYKTVSDAMECGGNWEIAEFEAPQPLTLEMVKESGGIVDKLRETAVRALIVFGHEEDVCFFITDDLEPSTDVSSIPTDKHCCGTILFEEKEEPEWGWVECPPPVEDKVEQVTIPVTIYITATGTNIRVKEDEIREKMVEVFTKTLAENDSDNFDSEFADFDLCVAETEVQCTEDFVYASI